MHNQHSVFHTEGGVPWDFPPQNSSFPPQDLLLLLYFVLLSHPNWHQLPIIVISKAMVLNETLALVLVNNIMCSYEPLFDNLWTCLKRAWMSTNIGQSECSQLISITDVTAAPPYRPCYQTVNMDYIYMYLKLVMNESLAKKFIVRMTAHVTSCNS